MAIYLCDWGKGKECNGSRFALIEASTLEVAWERSLKVGDAHNIRKLHLPEGYVEIESSQRAWSGPSLETIANTLFNYQPE